MQTQAGLAFGKPSKPTPCTTSPSTCGHEILGVIGESGSGKTTLGAAIAGLVKWSQGQMRFDGVPLAAGSARRTADQRRRCR
jgi:ABC-type oligopeptide transport system ATPase subunit